MAYNDNQDAYILTKGFTDELKEDKRIHISLPKLAEQLNNITGSDDIVVKTTQETKNKNILYGLVIPKNDMNKILKFGTDFKTTETQTKL